MDSDRDTSESPSSSSEFERDRHELFLRMMYQMLPHHYQSQEINRLTLAYFVLSGLHLLGSLNSVDKEAVADWVLSFQAHPRDQDDLDNGFESTSIANRLLFEIQFSDSFGSEKVQRIKGNDKEWQCFGTGQFYGFHGSRTSQFPPDDNGILVHNGSHLASTYCALAILKTIGYNFDNIDSELITKSMRNLQQPDGSFMPIHTGGETDLRFTYCAAAICYMLENWSGMNKEKAKEYILNCQSYDGGFGLTPGSESHGGGTYCAVASLRLMGFIEDDILSKNDSSSLINLPMLIDWSLQRQAADGGFQGRPNKDSDTCYAFWIGAVLRILGARKFIDEKSLRRFLLTCQSEYGGFSKFPGQLPDLYHSYYGLTAFSLLEEPGMNLLIPELGIADFVSTGI